VRTRDIAASEIPIANAAIKCGRIESRVTRDLMSGIGLKFSLAALSGNGKKYFPVIELAIALMMALISETPKAIRPLYWSLGATSAISALVVGATVWLSAATWSQNDWVRHTLEVRNQIAQILFLVQSAETGQRGYLLTSSQAYLIPYDRGTAAVGPAIDELGRLVIDNPQQVQSVGRLRELVKAKLDELAAIIEDHKSGHADRAIATVKSDDGLRLMDAIRQLLSRMEAVESQLLVARQHRAETLNTWLEVGAGLAFLLISAVGFLGMTATRRAFSHLAKARNELALSNRNLQKQIAQREEVESQLRQSQKMEAVGQLTGGIAHDFNNMLGVVIGSLDLMNRRIKNGDYAIGSFMEAATQATTRAASLTHRLLAFARQQPLEPKAIDVNNLIAGMSDLMRSTLGEQIEIETVMAAGLWTTTVDPHQLESAILNIAINSRDAMPQGGKLTIETGNTFLDDAYAGQHGEVSPGQYVMVAVSDNGTGMSSEIAARVFDPFFTTKPPGKGTGLGLSQVFGFTKQSKGHIKIYSEVGCGTTVKIYLPRLTDQAAITMPMALPAVSAVGTGEVILVVEDDLMMLKFTSEAVRELGYTAVHAENAIAALAVLDSRPDIKLLFTDVVMPDISGKKLVDEALLRHPQLKVLYTTGYTANAVVHGGVLDAGVNFLAKPFTIEQLAAKLRLVLDL
jgi:signal transduction histidine kinase